MSNSLIKSKTETIFDSVNCDRLKQAQHHKNINKTTTHTTESGPFSLFGDISVVRSQFAIGCDDSLENKNIESIRQWNKLVISMHGTNIIQRGMIIYNVHSERLKARDLCYFYRKLKLAQDIVLKSNQSGSTENDC